MRFRKAMCAAVLAGSAAVGVVGIAVGSASATVCEQLSYSELETNYNFYVDQSNIAADTYYATGDINYLDSSIYFGQQAQIYAGRMRNYQPC